MKNLFKKLAFLFSLVVLLTHTSSFRNHQNFDQNQIDDNCSSCRYSQCYATAKSTGLRCQHCVSNSGDIYCYQHK